MERPVKEFDSLIELMDDMDKEGITGTQRRDAIAKFMREKARGNSIPFSGSFELTPLCNLDCKMCYVHLAKDQMQRPLLTTEQWLRIFEQAIDEGLLYADITGGECLTYPGFKDIYLFLLSRGVRVSVLTNGILLDDEMVAFFTNNPPSLIQITLYGSNGEAYKKVTGHDVFQQVVDGIYRVKNAGLNVRLTYTPNKFMEDNSDVLLDTIRSFGVDYEISGSILAARKETGRNLDDYIPTINNMLILQKKNLDIIKNQPHTDDLYRKKYRFRVANSKHEGIPCASGKCTFHVSWDNKIYPCAAYTEEWLDMDNLTFKEAWTKLNVMMESYKPPEECANCSMKSACAVCVAEKTFGVLNGKLNTAVCERVKTYIGEGMLKLLVEECN